MRQRCRYIWCIISAYLHQQQVLDAAPRQTKHGSRSCRPPGSRLFTIHSTIPLIAGNYKPKAAGCDVTNIQGISNEEYDIYSLFRIWFNFMCNSVVKQEMCLSSAGELSLCVLMLITLLFAEAASSLKLVCHRKAFQCLAFSFFLFVLVMETCLWPRKMQRLNYQKSSQ